MECSDLTSQKCTVLSQPPDINSSICSWWNLTAWEHPLPDNTQTPYWPCGVFRSDIPEVNGIIPTSGYKLVCMIMMKLDREHSVTMSIHHVPRGAVSSENKHGVKNKNLVWLYTKPTMSLLQFPRNETAVSRDRGSHPFISWVHRNKAQLFFDRVCGPKSKIPISKDISHSKTADRQFFWTFCKSETHFYGGFLS